MKRSKENGLETEKLKMWHLAATLACALSSAGAKLVHEAAVELAPAFASVDADTKLRLR